MSDGRVGEKLCQLFCVREVRNQLLELCQMDVNCAGDSMIKLEKCMNVRDLHKTS